MRACFCGSLICNVLIPVLTANDLLLECGTRTWCGANAACQSADDPESLPADCIVTAVRIEYPTLRRAFVLSLEFCIAYHPAMADRASLYRMNVQL